MQLVTASNVDVVRELYAAFGRGDLPGMFKLLDPGVVWHCPSSDTIPWAGRFHGTAGVQQFLTAVAANVDFDFFAPHTFVGQNDHVVVLGSERVRVKSTGHAFETDWCHAYTMSNGMVATFREYTDTAAVERAFRG